MARKMKNCPWEIIDPFESYSEFERFVGWMRDQVASGAARELPVTQAYRGISSLKEKWFEHIGSGRMWRLLEPDPPFGGFFKYIGDD